MFYRRETKTNLYSSIFFSFPTHVTCLEPANSDYRCTFSTIGAINDRCEQLWQCWSHKHWWRGQISGRESRLVESSVVGSSSARIRRLVLYQCGVFRPNIDLSSDHFGSYMGDKFKPNLSDMGMPDNGEVHSWRQSDLIV